MTHILTLTDITTANRSSLIKMWRTRFGSDPPPKISQSLLRQVLGFHFQSKAQGGLDAKTKRQIARLQNQLDQPAACAQRSKPTNQLQSGSHILREWNGVTHRVEVTDDGFVWQATRFKSLSAIAHAITGTKWSGPRFFGLDKVVS